MLAPGTTIAGYEIESVVGSGGIGVLYRARQLRLNRPVALKLVEPQIAADPLVRERLRREARTVGALDHPNVVPLYEAGEENGTVFIATRWIDGTELGALIRKDGPLRPRRAARLVAQMASALEVAHEKGLIHRDVKPSNAIVTPEDHVYITDFGLTKRAASMSGFTATGQMLGTVDYAAPEQIEGGEAGATRRRLWARLRPLRDPDGSRSVCRRDRRNGQDVGAAQRRAPVRAREAARRAGGTRRGDRAGTRQAARRSSLGGGVRSRRAGGRRRDAVTPR